ncbi:MAG: endolytic transglycosylase MltG [Acidobacteriaceae bacterium]
MRRFFFLLVLAALVAAGAVAFTLLVPAGPQSPTLVNIAPGTSTSRIAAELKDQGLIRSQYVFVALALGQGRTLKAGEYRFDHPARMEEVWSKLARGDVYTLTVTIPEGSNIFDIGARLEAAGLGTKEAFLEAAKQDTDLVADLDPKAPSLEGYLFPNTYRFIPQATPRQIATMMVEQFRDSARSLGLTSDYHRVVTLASLVEKETPIEAERPLVASVFVNRLDKKMPLMTDPSVIYAALLQGRYRGAIYESDLASDSSYNTYQHAGLPPGPICNPSVQSLEAAMRPAQTNYLYFVAGSADPSGTSRFSATLEEHRKDVQAYRRAVRRAERSGGHGSGGERP